MREPAHAHGGWICVSLPTSLFRIPKFNALRVVISTSSPSPSSSPQPAPSPSSTCSCSASSSTLAASATSSPPASTGGSKTASSNYNGGRTKRRKKSPGGDRTRKSPSRLETCSFLCCRRICIRRLGWRDSVRASRGSRRIRRGVVARWSACRCISRRRRFRRRRLWMIGFIRWRRRRYILRKRRRSIRRKRRGNLDRNLLRCYGRTSKCIVTMRRSVCT
jgi:hypothetical protein